MDRTHISRSKNAFSLDKYLIPWIVDSLRKKFRFTLIFLGTISAMKNVPIIGKWSIIFLLNSLLLTSKTYLTNK